jgi:sterol desaturase/sphingolipid hydroxylase (fatty acid hydroxylase superfamily)
LPGGQGSPIVKIGSAPEAALSLIAWSIPGFIALIALEFVVARGRGRDVYRLPVAVSDVSCGITSQLFNLLTAGVGVAAYLWLYEHRWLDLDPLAPSTWVAATLAVDLVYYAWHRASHEVNCLWAAHIVHHHSEDYNLAVALRQALLTGFTSLPFFLPLALLGVPPVVYLVSKALNTLYQFWIHTELIGRLGPLEAVLNTPSHHRVHHAINPRYLDRNYGGILIVWDRLFGSFEPEGERPVYGTTKPLRSLHPLWANLHYFGEMAALAARARTWRQWIRAWFAHPSWRPEGEVPPPTADELRRPRYDPRASPAVTRYVALQAALAVPATMWLLVHAQRTPWPTTVAGVALVAAGTVAWAGLFERRAWAWPLELTRVAGSVALLRTLTL